MATSQDTVVSILSSLKSSRFSAKKMFGEYALYADGKVVALVCDDLLYVKVHETTEVLVQECEQGTPYPGAKRHHILDEGQWMSRRDLPDLLIKLAAALPAPKAKKRSGKASL